MRQSEFSAAAIVFAGGFVCLSLEVLAPRILFGYYGNTQLVWCASIVTTLGGLAAGYWIGGAVSPERVIWTLRFALLGAGIYTACLQQIIMFVATAIGHYSIQAIIATAAAAGLLPSMLLGMIAPLVIQHLSRTSPKRLSVLVGRTYAMGTIGSILGGLLSSLVGAQLLGVSLSLKIMAAGLIVLGTLIGLPWVFGLLLVGAIAVPYKEELTDRFRLVERAETAYQTVRVFETGDGRRVIMTFGPTCESSFDRTLGIADSPYARIVSKILTDRSPRSVLIIGAAGNALALELERRGVDVSIVELDPELLHLSAEHFGVFHGSVFIGDARAVLRWSDLGRYDAIVMDAFSGPGALPPQLVTHEFFRDLRHVLKEGGVLIVNTMGSCSGRYARALEVVEATLASVFANVRDWPVMDGLPSTTKYQNVLFICSDGPVSCGSEWIAANVPIATDDRNPIEYLMLDCQVEAWGGIKSEWSVCKALR